MGWARIRTRTLQQPRADTLALWVGEQAHEDLELLFARKRERGHAIEDHLTALKG